ncbi:hypothetical protein K470DRAFT_130981 [Piedraia hortae CBS 480.64]|uniref:C2H2-type domain-containing protein n=1 Tax=Piedraia hortae CBS 480.64 TaxID=1314780 RepID=A0A6A7BUQ7_9PEZI|nr:hypothetical protein K470DRAFT_130981 [Piedraia hortae CBS 480.64]
MPLYRTFPGLPDSPDRPEGPVSPFNFLDPNDTLFGFADDEGPRPLFGDSLGQSAASWRNFPHAASGARTEPGKPYSMVDEVTTTTLSMMNEHADQAELARVDALIRAQKVPGYCILDDCLKYYTTTSAFKRHFYQHVKPFLCRGPDCIQRFANGNDLDRHRSSVHQQRCPGKKRYRCAECPEPVDGKKKVWPRKDNFVSHCKRKHGDKVNATVQR